MMLPSRLGCPLSLKTPNMGNVGTNQLFKVQNSKPIIDRIDHMLAEHYGFTDEELDFIINYDIKYCMGRGG